MVSKVFEGGNRCPGCGKACVNGRNFGGDGIIIITTAKCKYCGLEKELPTDTIMVYGGPIEK